MVLRDTYLKLGIWVRFWRMLWGSVPIIRDLFGRDAMKNSQLVLRQADGQIHTSHFSKCLIDAYPCASCIPLRTQVKKMKMPIQHVLLIRGRVLHLAQSLLWLDYSLLL